MLLDISPVAWDHLLTTKYAGKANAPEFPAGIDWINIDQPLTKSDVAGKLVILDFWTYC